MKSVAKLLHCGLLVACFLISPLEGNSQDLPISKAEGKINREGEIVLKKLLNAHHKLKGFHVRILQEYPTNDWPSYMKYDHVIDLWFESQNSFPLEVSDLFWGGGSIVINDGKTLLSDPLHLSLPVELDKAPATSLAGLPQLALRQPGASLFYSLLDGEKAFDRIVKIDSSITQEPMRAGLKSLRFVHPVLGKIILSYDPNDPQMLTKQIDWELQPGSRLIRQQLNYVQLNTRFVKDLFKTLVPHGVSITDKRLK